MTQFILLIGGRLSPAGRLAVLTLLSFGALYYVITNRKELIQKIRDKFQ